MQKFDHKSLKYGIIGIQERVLPRQDKQVIRVGAIEVLLFNYFIPPRFEINSSK